VAPGAAQLFQAAFTPPDAGNFTGEIRFGNDGPGANPYVLKLSGQGITSGPPSNSVTSSNALVARLGVYYGSTLLPDASSLKFLSVPTNISFGATLTITNEGSTNLVITNWVVNSPFTLSNAPSLPVTLPS